MFFEKVHQKEVRQKLGGNRVGWSWSTKLKSDIKQEVSEREGKIGTDAVSACAPPPVMGIGPTSGYHSCLRISPDLHLMEHPTDLSQSVC